MYMKNNVARCIRAVQKRQEVNFNNSFFYSIWFYLKSLKKKLCRAYSTYCWKQLLTEIVCCCHRLKLWRRPHYTTKSIYSQQLWQVLPLSLVLAYNLCSKLYTNSLNTSLPLHTLIVLQYNQEILYCNDTVISKKPVPNNLYTTQCSTISTW